MSAVPAVLGSKPIRVDSELSLYNQKSVRTARAAFSHVHRQKKAFWAITNTYRVLPVTRDTGLHVVNVTESSDDTETCLFVTIHRVRSTFTFLRLLRLILLQLHS